MILRPVRPQSPSGPPNTNALAFSLADLDVHVDLMGAGRPGAAEMNLTTEMLDRRYNAVRIFFVTLRID